ncbi:MAG: adenylosuccinate lyase, partial [Clostridiales bacterium]|nr:adenylosuccinate lyase [Clostridiales bacterium]
NVAGGLAVYPKMIERHLAEELPFMVTENILMAAVKKGGDRQGLHEVIRRHSNEAARKVKLAGESNDLFERIAGDPAFRLSREEVGEAASADKLVGRAKEQTAEFLIKAAAVLRENEALLAQGYEDQIKV